MLTATAPAILRNFIYQVVLCRQVGLRPRSGRHVGNSHVVTATVMAGSDDNLQIFHAHGNQFSYAFDRNCYRPSAPSFAFRRVKNNMFIESVLLHDMFEIVSLHDSLHVLKSLIRRSSTDLLFITSVLGMESILPQHQHSKEFILVLPACMMVHVTQTYRDT